MIASALIILQYALHSLDNLDDNDTIDLDISNYYSLDGFSILSLSVQSINAKGKYEECSLFIETVSKLSDIEVICLQETWLSNTLFELPSYSLIAYGKHAVLMSLK